MRKHIIGFYYFCLLYLIKTLCIFNVHDYEYLKQEVEGWDSYGGKHLSVKDVRICKRCYKKQAIFNSVYGKRYETIN